MIALDPTSLAILLAVAFATSLVGGLAGYGTGLLLPPVLAPMIGGEAVVPVIAVTALFSNIGRIAAYRANLDGRMALRIALFALPGTIIAAVLYSRLSGPGALLLIGTTILLLVPVRYLARRWQLTLRGRSLDAASVAYGSIVGATSGSGILLLSILLAAGKSGAAVIATDAAISIGLVTVKSATFLATGALDGGLILLAVLIGLVSLPGGFIAKALAGHISEGAHLRLLDIAVVLGALVLIHQGWSA